MLDRGTELELIPRSVRDKLDRVGIKLHLRDWQALPLSERQLLRDLPCEGPDEAALYAARVERLIVQLTGQRPERLQHEDKG